MVGYLRKTRKPLRWKHWSYAVEVLCGLTDGEHEIRKTEAYVDWWWLGARADDGHGDTKSHCNDACDPRTDEPEVCVPKTYERFAWARSTTRGNCFGKWRRIIRNSECIPSSRLSACRIRHGCGQWNSLISKQNIYAVWLRCMCASVKKTRFPGNAPVMRDVCTQICVNSSGISIMSSCANSTQDDTIRMWMSGNSMYAFRVEDCPFVLQKLIGLETSRIVAAILEPQKTFGSGLDILVFGSVLVMTDDDETSQVSTQKFTVLRHKNWSCKYMEDMYCDSDYNNVILFSVINKHLLRMSSWCGHQEDGWYVSVYDAEWRNVHSRNLSMSLLWRSATLYEYDLVQPQHIDVWWWTDQYEGNVRTVWRKCRTTFTATLLQLSGWWVTKLLICRCVLTRDWVNVW